MVIPSKRFKPGNFESHNSLKLMSFTNISGLRSNFVEYEDSLNETLLTFWLH